VTARWGFTPHGTARERFVRSAAGKRRGGAPAAFEFPAELRGAADSYDLGQEALYLAWELARLATSASDSARRGLLYLALASIIAERQGSTRLPVRDDGPGGLGAVLARLGASDADVAAARGLIDDPSPVREVIGAPGAYKPLILDGDALVQQRLAALEHRLVEALRARLEESPDALDGGGGVDVAIAEAPAPLSDQQQAAVYAAVERSLTVITGGPGTGKTSIVVTIVRAMLRLGVPAEAIALAAPTGKAAKRMHEALAAGGVDGGVDGLGEPSTLHRLLGYSPVRDQFRHHENNPLAQRVVIVDESSMVDLALMERLARSVRPSARLILLGDADQLPSVEAGAVFRDLVDAGLAVELTHSYRMDAGDPAGRHVLEVARAVNEAQQLDVPKRASAAKVTMAGVELIEAGLRDAFFDRWYRERIRFDGYDARVRKTYRHGKAGFDDDDLADLRALFDGVARSRVLAITRETPRTGAEALNERFHRRILEDFGGTIHGATAFYPGEPIMMLRNDYDRGLFNGDQGLVLRVAEGGEGARHHFMAVFPRKHSYAVYHLDALRSHVELAFAMTVHKAQGSEHDHVALVLPERDIPLTSRELIYTAITRSRTSATIIGDPSLLAAGARRKLHRHSGVRARLNRTAEGPAPAGARK